MASRRHSSSPVIQISALMAASRGGCRSSGSPRGYPEGSLFLLLARGPQGLIDGDTGQVSEQAVPIDPAQQRQAQAAALADGALEQEDRGGGEREDQLVDEAAQLT
jgi:hypothetical protein